MKRKLLIGLALTMFVFTSCSKDDDAPATVAVESITVTGSNIATLGGTSTMSTSVLPANATDKTVKWSVDNEAIATIDEGTGVLTAVSNGDVTVTATSKGAPSVKGIKKVIVSGQDKPLVGTKWFLFSENGMEVNACRKKSYVVFSATEVNQFNAGGSPCVTPTTGNSYNYTDNGDGTGEVAGMTTTFSISGDTATVDISGNVSVYKAK